MSGVRAISTFVVSSMLLISLSTILITSAIFKSYDARHAVIVSAITAFIVQVASFTLVWRLRTWNVMGAWGLGVLLRVFTLGIYTLIAVKVLQLPAAPALFSLVTFFFLTSLAEPWLLR